MVVDEFKFVKSQVDGCDLIKTDKEGTVILCIYVDDALIVGDLSAIEKTALQLRTKVSLKEVGPLQDYVGCTVIRNKDSNKLWMIQPDLIKMLEISTINNIDSQALKLTIHNESKLPKLIYND
jgi:Reverse transcriptase (RNA-dependent DNA polymerase)